MPACPGAVQRFRGLLLGSRRQPITYRLFSCQRCQALVGICSTCDHGNRYCSEECSDASRAESVARLGAEYQRTHDGSEKHAQRQRAYMTRLRFFAGIILLHLAAGKEMTQHCYAGLAVSISVSGSSQTPKEPEDGHPTRSLRSRPRLNPTHCAICREPLPAFARLRTWHWSG